VENTVNILGLNSLVTTLKILTAFLKTHQYPAWSEGEKKVASIMELEKVADKRNRSGNEDIGGPRKRTTVGTRANPVVEEDIVMDPVNPDTDPVYIWRAKPGLSDVQSYGPISNLPVNSGIFFPFLSDLTNRDPLSPPKLIERYFLKCLGPTTTEQFNAMDRLRRAFQDISKTMMGDWLAHMAQVIDLSLRSQAQPFVIVDSNQYVGTVILGANFHIGLYGKVYAPIPSAQLQIEVENAGSHTVNLKAIANVAEPYQGSDVEGILAAKSMWALSELLVHLELDEDDSQTVLKLARGLHFGDHYFAVNADTIMSVYTTIFDERPFETDPPMHPSVLLSKNRVHKVISSFGFLAPSLSIPSGKTVKLAEATTLDPFFICLKPIDQVVADIERIKEKRAFLNLPGDLSKNSKFRAFRGEEARRIGGVLQLVKAVTVEKGAVDMVMANDAPLGSVTVFDAAFD